MAIITIPRTFGGTLILTVSSLPSTLPTTVVLATFRSGQQKVAYRDGRQAALYRDGNVQSGGR